MLLRVLRGVIILTGLSEFSVVSLSDLLPAESDTKQEVLAKPTASADQVGQERLGGRAQEDGSYFRTHQIAVE